MLPGWRLLDLQVFLAALEGLEVSELVDPPHARLERLGVEDAAFDEAQFPPDDLVAGRRVPGERNAIDEVLRSLGDANDHVHRRRLVRVGSCRQQGRRSRGIQPVRRSQIWESREFHVASGPVDLARLFETLANVALAVPVTRVQL